jgi:hypothetical protein
MMAQSGGGMVFPGKGGLDGLDQLRELEWECCTILVIWGLPGGLIFPPSLFHFQVLLDSSSVVEIKKIVVVNVPSMQ